MLIASPRCLQANSASNHKYVETPQAPHHSLICIEDQSSLQISHPAPQSHDPIHWRNHTQRELFLRKNYLPFLFFLIYHSQKSVHSHRMCTMCCNTMVCPPNVFIVILLFPFCGCIQNSRMLVFTILSFLCDGLLEYLSGLLCLHQHGPTNVQVAALEILLHISRPMHCLMQEQEQCFLSCFLCFLVLFDCKFFFSYLFYFRLLLSFSCLFCLLFMHPQAQLQMKLCLALETSKVKYMRTFTTINNWSFVVLSLYEELDIFS